MPVPVHNVSPTHTRLAMFVISRYTASDVLFVACCANHFRTNVACSKFLLALHLTSSLTWLQHSCTPSSSLWCGPVFSCFARVSSACLSVAHLFRQSMTLTLSQYTALQFNPGPFFSQNSFMSFIIHLLVHRNSIFPSLPCPTIVSSFSCSSVSSTLHTRIMLFLSRSLPFLLAR